MNKIYSKKLFSLSRPQRYAILSACLAFLAFPPLPLGFLSCLAFVPLLIILDEIARDQQPRLLRRTFRIGYLFGLVFNFGLLYWIGVVRWILVPGMLLTVFILASYYALLFVIAVYLRRAGLSFQLTIPFLWLALDYWLNQTECAVPWANLGYTFSSYIPLIQFISITGIVGATFFIILINILIFDVWQTKTRRKWIVNGTIIVALVAIAWTHGIWTINKGLPENTSTIKVGLIQPSYSMDMKWDDDLEEYVVREQLEMSESLLPEKPDLIVWAESSVPAYLHYKPRYRYLLGTFAYENQTPLLVGAPHVVWGPDNEKFIYNSAFLINKNGKLSKRYDKLHLVPFAERMPYQEYFPILQKYDLGQANFSIGKEYTIFEIPEGKFGAGICYETVFPQISQRLVSLGAQFLVTITNDTWYGPTTAPPQHAAMHRMRCIENRISLVRCANSGISLFADPFGRLIEKSEFYDTLTMSATIPLRTNTTFYTRYGDTFAKLCLLGLMIILVVGLWRNRT